MNKPLNIKAYGSIGHIPGSRLGDGDHCVPEGQARIATEKLRDKHDQVFVYEKLDGSCCAVAMKDGRLIPLVRSGYIAESSSYVQHHVFADWVFHNQDKFFALLNDGERVVGEWLAQAYGTLYSLKHDPFVVFDMFSKENKRLAQKEALPRLQPLGFIIPAIIGFGSYPCPVRTVQYLLYVNRNFNYHGRIDPAEGAVWRVERNGSVDFLCKWVHQDFVPGKYLPGIAGCERELPLWNRNLELYLPPKAIKRLDEFDKNWRGDQ